MRQRIMINKLTSGADLEAEDSMVGGAREVARLMSSLA
jgi:hypothetical protein